MACGLPREWQAETAFFRSLAGCVIGGCKINAGHSAQTAGLRDRPERSEKTRQSRKKPLPRLAIEILQQQYVHSGYLRLAFPSNTTRERPISENTMNQALRRMGFRQNEATSHGFRATASTLLNESGLWNADAIKAEIARVSGNEVRRAYHRAEYWDERVKMADWWAAQIMGRWSHKCLFG
jgi:integrase